MKKTNMFNRLMSLVLSFSLVMSLFGDFPFSTPLFADESNKSPEMHVMVGYWTNDGAVPVECYIYQDLDNPKPYFVKRDVDGSSFPEGSGLNSETGVFTVKLDESLDGVEFSGFAISAGYEAVTIHDDDPDNRYLEIKYDENIHLVKVHVFYTENVTRVEGVDMESGAGIKTDIEQDTAFYLKATKIVDGKTTIIYSNAFDNASDINVSLDSNGEFVYDLKEDAKKEDFYTDFKSLYSDYDITVVKRYDNSAGLHTDKTVTAAENNPEGSRKFDVTLESWFSGNAIADVGLILDASGSMAFISDGLEPYAPDDKLWEDTEEYTLLTPAQVENVLEPELTDNSKLGYSDYTYFIYDRRNDTREFVPIGYWGGYLSDSKTVNRGTEPAEKGYEKGLIGYWKFEKDLVNSISSEPAKVVAHPVASEGNYTTQYTDTSKISYSSSNFGNGGNNSLVLSNDTMSESGVLLDVAPKNDSFTLSFAFRLKTADTSNDKSSYGSIMYIGNVKNTHYTFNKGTTGKEDKIDFTDGGNNYGALFYRAKAGSKNHLRLGYNTDSATSGSSSMNNQINNTDYHFYTYVVENGNVTTYIDGKPSTTEASTSKQFNLESYSDLGIVLGGFWNTDYLYDSMYLDDVVLHDRALGADEVADLYDYIKTGGTGADEEKGTPVAVLDKDSTSRDILATFVEVTENAEPENLAGWYYVNSNSNWKDHYGDETVATAKDYRYTVGGDAVENRIVIADLPLSAQIAVLKKLGYDVNESYTGQALRNHVSYVLANSKDEVYDLKPQELLDKLYNGDGKGENHKAYIYTGSKDFTSDKDVIIVDTFGNDKIESKVKVCSQKDIEDKYSGDYDQAVKDGVYPVAISLPGNDRQNYKTSAGKYSSPLLFFIDGMGYLRCVFSNNNSITKAGDSEQKLEVSYVYKKDDSTRIKAEELQYALGAFNSELEKASPNSRVAAVRFSTQLATKVTDNLIITEGVDESEDHLDNLVLLDWTKNAEAATKMLSVKRGNGSSTDSEEQKIDYYVDSEHLGDEIDNEFKPISVYNYGLTGGTNTLLGLMAYKKTLDNLNDDTSRAKRADPDREKDKKKYLIIFTDGKDSNVQKYDPSKTSNDSNNNYKRNIDNTYKLATEFREKGYTIFFVLLTGGAFSVDNDVKDFVAHIAGNYTEDELEEAITKAGSSANHYDNITVNLSNPPATASGGKYVFEASSGEELKAAFSDYILGAVSDSLRDYTVQDYIDPRFDFVDVDGNKYVLKNPTTDNTPNVEIISPSGDIIPTILETVDGSKYCKVKVDGHNESGEALLGYDSDKSMYFMRWINQDIPGCTTSDPDIAIWKSKITLEAKEDFIGGNAVLTNGNAIDENYVWSKTDVDPSSGVNQSIRGESETAEVSKGFPRTAANVRLYDPKMSNGDKTIYLGETISPKDIIDALAKSMSTPPAELPDGETAEDYEHSRLYWDYIERYYSSKFASGGVQLLKVKLLPKKKLLSL